MSGNLIARARGFAARLRRCDNGLAFVEFAMALPVLTTLSLAGLESANLALAHLRVSNIAMMAADNGSRVRDSIDESNIIELFTGTKLTGDSIDFRNNGRIVLSSIEQSPFDDENNGNGNDPGGCDESNPGDGECENPNGAQWIRWQRCDGARNVASAYGAQGAGQNDATLQSVGSSDNRISAGEGTAVILAEVVYEYQPLVSDAIFGQPIIRYEAAFNVRQRTNQALTNTSNLNSAQVRTCNHFEA